MAVSVFASHEPDPLFSVAYKIETGGAVEAIVHPADLEPQAGLLAEQQKLLSGTYALSMVSEAPDEDVVGGETCAPASGHKLLGEPNIFRDPSDWEQTLSRLDATGFVHYLQLDTPRQEDPFVGEAWPLPNGMLHLYLHATAIETKPRWFSEF